MTSFVFVLAALACYRLTLLVTDDEITRPWRERIKDWAEPPIRRSEPIADVTVAETAYGLTVSGTARPPSSARDVLSDLLGGRVSWRSQMVTLLGCPWCVSVWIAPLIVASALAWGNGWGWQLAAGSLAASAVTGALASYARP